MKERLIALLRWSERYTKTDMVYLATSGFWSNLGTVSVSLASFLLYIVFSRYLPKDAYGTYQYLLSIGAIVGAFTLTGMNAAVTRAVALGYEGSLRHAVSIQLKWNVLPMLGAWLVGGYYLWAGNPILGWGLVLVGIFVPLNNALNTYGAFLNGKKDFRRIFLYGLWWNIPYYIAVGIVAYFFHAALVLLAANLISQTIGLIIAYRHTLRTYQPSAADSAETQEYGNHLSAMGLFSSIVAQMDVVLAFHFLGSVELAVYSFATALPDRISALFKFLPAAAFPKFSEKEPAEIRVGLARRLGIGTLIAVIVALIYIALAHALFALFFPNYLDAVPYSQLYAFVLAATMGGVVTNALLAHARIKTLYAFNIVTPTVQLALQVAGVLLFGLWGLIGAKILGALFSLLFGSILYWTLE